MEAGTYRGFGLTLRDPGIALVTFNQPERLNGMTQGLKRDLVETLLQVQMDDAIRVVVFTGSGRAFSAGDDISGHRREADRGEGLVPDIPGGHRDPIGTYEGLRNISQPLNLAVRNLDKITIRDQRRGDTDRAVAGWRWPATSASPRTRLGWAAAPSGSGYLPDEGGQFLLVQLMGVAKAIDFLLRARIVNAEEALELGLVNEVVSPERLQERAMELAVELANGPQVAMRLLKRSIYNAAEMTFAHALDEIAAKTAISDHHPDARGRPRLPGKAEAAVQPACDLRRLP